MNKSRRQFLKSSLVAATAAITLPSLARNGDYKIFDSNITPSILNKYQKTAKMKLSWTSYNLQLKHTFTISGFSRTTTPVVLTKIEYDGLVGYGEASLPPYLGETQESVISFLKKVDLFGFTNPTQIEEIVNYIDSLALNNTAAKASVDIALHDLAGKIIGSPWYKIHGLNKYDA